MEFIWGNMERYVKISGYYVGERASQLVLVVKSPPANAGDIRDVGSIPGSGRFPGGGHGHSVQYSFLESLHGQRSLGSQRIGHD